MKSFKHLLMQLIMTIVVAYHGFCRQSLAANTYDAAVRTHSATIQRTNDVAVSTRHLLWTQGSTDYGVKLATASLPAIGTIDNIETSTGINEEVILLGMGSTVKMVASGAITAGQRVYQDAAGKVSASGTLCVGIAQTSTTADTQILEVLSDISSGSTSITATDATITGSSGSVAIPITNRQCEISSTGAYIGTVADGTFIGQRLMLVMASASGTVTVTPAHGNNFTSIALLENKQACDLEWTTNGWLMCGFSYITTKPLIA